MERIPSAAQVRNAIAGSESTPSPNQCIHDFIRRVGFSGLSAPSDGRNNLYLPPSLPTVVLSSSETRLVCEGASYGQSLRMPDHAQFRRVCNSQTTASSRRLSTVRAIPPCFPCPSHVTRRPAADLLPDTKLCDVAHVSEAAPSGLSAFPSERPCAYIGATSTYVCPRTRPCIHCLSP